MEAFLDSECEGGRIFNMDDGEFSVLEHLPDHLEEVAIVSFFDKFIE